MKIAVLDFGTSTVDIISVDAEWLKNDLRQALPEWYEDEEWDNFDDDELIAKFLFEFCQYNDSNIQYMVEPDTIQYLTPKEFN